MATVLCTAASDAVGAVIGAVVVSAVILTLVLWWSAITWAEEAHQ